MLIRALKLKTLSLTLGFTGLALLATSCTMFTSSDEFVPQEDNTVQTTCDKMCELVMDNCSDVAPQYNNDFDTCVASCEPLVKGTPGDQSGNTQECRLYHASVASTGAAVHCPHTGESGAGVCVGEAPVDVCGPLCSDLAELCTDDFATAFPADDISVQLAACANDCKKLRKDGKPGDNFGNSLQCRETYFHRSQKSDLNAAFFCEAAQPVAAGIYACTEGNAGRCDALCLNYIAVCDRRGPWATEDDCYNECDAFVTSAVLVDFNCLIDKMHDGQCDVTAGPMGACSTIGIP